MEVIDTLLLTTLHHILSRYLQPYSFHQYSAFSTTDATLLHPNPALHTLLMTLSNPFLSTRPSSRLKLSPVRMDQHLRIPIDALIELLIRARRLIDTDLMRHHETRLRAPRNNQVAQVAVVVLDVALARAYA